MKTKLVIHKSYTICYVAAYFPLKKRGRGNYHALSKCIVQAENIGMICGQLSMLPLLQGVFLHQASGFRVRS